MCKSCELTDSGEINIFSISICVEICSNMGRVGGEEREREREDKNEMSTCVAWTKDMQSNYFSLSLYFHKS